MFLSKRLIKKTGWLSILTLFYVAAGLPLIHPFFHHHCEKHGCVAEHPDLNRRFSDASQRLKQLHRHSHCCICSFLKSFHIHHPVTISVQDYEQGCLKVNLLPFSVFFIKPIEKTDLLPRPPPMPVA